MSRRKLYYKSLYEAQSALNKFKESDNILGIEIHKMPKGTRHHGMYYVGSFMDWLNFAN